MRMSKNLVVSINDESQMEYDRTRVLPDHQQQFVQRMDDEMKASVVINGEKIEQPDLQQRAQFVAINLFQAILESNEQTAAAMLAYLANYLPDLKQVKANITERGVLIDLVFDQNFVSQVTVQLTPNKSKN